MERNLFALLAFAASLGLPAHRCDAGSTLYVSSTSSGQILSFDSNGSESVFASGLSNPTGLAVDHSGNVYVTAGSTIEKYSATGHDLGTFATGLNGPGGLAIDASGNVYVTLYGSNSIEKFSSTGQDLGTFASGLDAPNRVAVNSAGDLYVTNGYAGAVNEYSRTGQLIATLAGVGNPIGLALDAAGNVYVSNTASNEIQEFSSSGQYLGVFASTGLSNAARASFQCERGPFRVQLHRVDPGVLADGCLSRGLRVRARAHGGPGIRPGIRPGALAAHLGAHRAGSDRRTGRIQAASVVGSDVPSGIHMHPRIIRRRYPRSINSREQWGKRCPPLRDSRKATGGRG